MYQDLAFAGSCAVIPKIIHYCWLSNDPIPKELRHCMDSWKAKLTGYQFMLWDTSRFDPHSSVWVEQAVEAKQYAFAADFIRLYAVYTFGGIYLDMDVEVLKPFDALLDADIMAAYEDKTKRKIEAGCFGARQGSPAIKKVLEYYAGRSFVKSDGTYDTKVLPEIMKDRLVAGNIAIYGNDFFTVLDYMTGKMNRTANSYAIHHFAGSWKSSREQNHNLTERKIRRTFGNNFFSGFIMKLYDIFYLIKKIKIARPI
jgi:mannosyltransferase OCH1-like enzyme